MSISLSFAAHASAEAAKLSDAQSAVLQTDGPRAARLFQQVAGNDAASTRDRLLARCGLARLAGRMSMPMPMLSGDALADRIIGSYRRYWQAAIDPAMRVRAEARLFDELRQAIRKPRLQDRDAVLTEVSVQLNARGIRTSQGKTATLYDLLLYLDEEEKPYTVELTDGTRESVQVFLMREMVSHGWSRYFTCGDIGTGGFAVEDGLYAVAEKYNLDGEEFLVSFLGHETRHFADDKRFPGMEGPELEYRAKLTELGLADKTMPKLLDRFQNDQNDDRATPHSHANKRVLAAVRQQLGLPAGADLKQADPARLREAARALLQQDNEERDCLK